MNMDVFVFYLVVFLEVFIAVLPWLLGLCGLLLVIYIGLLLTDKFMEWRGR